jgi:thioredoxin 1
VKIGKLNVDENQAISEKYGVMGVPTILFIKNGEIKDKIVGLRSKAEIQNIIDNNI